MNEKIQNNITNSDLAYDVTLRIDFVETVSASDLDSIDSQLSAGLMELGIGFGSAQGVDFISAALLDFGDAPTFTDLRNCVNEVLSSYAFIIKLISYNKSEFTQANFNFISEKNEELETVLKNAKFVFHEVDFTEISSASDSPEHTYFSGSDSENTITLFISEINYNQKDWIRFSIGCKRLNDDEKDALLKRVNQVQSNSVSIKWKGLEYNYETESWELPKRNELFEFI